MSKQKLIEAMFQKMNDAVFFLKRNEVLYMNPKAMELISKFEVDLFNMPSICHVCNGMTNEKGYQTCSSCFIEGDKNLESFQLFLAKKTIQIQVIFHLAAATFYWMSLRKLMC